MSAVSDRLPAFPWDKLEPYKATAAAHPDGIVDLSVGTPVDPVPELIQQALIAAADSPGLSDGVGHPGAARRDHRLGGAPARRARRHPPATSCRSSAPRNWSPGCRPSSASARATRWPTRGSPTRRTRSAPGWPAPSPWSTTTRRELDPAGLKLLWLNSPSNPTGKVLSKDGADPDRRLGARARRAGLQRRVLPGAGLGGRARLGPPPGRLRRLVRGHRRRPLALQALQPGRLPRGLPRGRPGRPRRAAPDPQARRHDDLGAGPGGGGRGPRRRRARGGAARALRGPPRRRCAPRWRPTASGSSTARRASTSGPRATSPAGRPSPTWPTSASWWRRATSTARRATASSGWP